MDRVERMQLAVSSKSGSGTVIAAVVKLSQVPAASHSTRRRRRGFGARDVEEEDLADIHMTFHEANPERRRVSR